MFASATNLSRLVKTSILAGLAVPAVCAGYVTLAGLSVARRLPVPVRFAVCGLLRPLSVRLNVPVLVPVAVGVNVTPIAQLPPGARVVEHVVVEIAMPVTVTVCLLVKVNVFDALVVPTACAG